MIERVVIRDNKNSPLHYLSNLDVFNNGTAYVFKLGINVIVGENGSGKTTLLKLIERYLLVDNLEWCSYSYNTKYNNSMRTRLDTRNNNQSHGCEKKVYQYDLHGSLVKVWDSVKSISRKLGYKPTNISSCCLNKKYRKTAYGYKWSYESL